MHELIAVEYWIDGDLANVVKSAVPAASEYLLDTRLNLSALSNGLHFISYRFQDEAGLWSAAFSHLFSKYEDEVLTTGNKIVAYRYWVNDQIGSAIEVSLATPVQTLDLDELLDVSSLPGGTNDISFQFIDSVGNRSSALTKSYNQDYNPRGTISADNNPACGGTTVTFTAETFDTDSIYWDFGDNTAIVGRTVAENAYHAYADAGDYTVSAILKQASSGNTDTVYTSIAVNQSYGLSVVAPENLIAFYPFDGNADDASGNQLDGTVNGASLTDDRNGNSNSAYLFDGNDGIDISHSDKLNMDGALSVSCWIKPALLQNAMIFGKSNYTSATNYLLRVQSDGNIQWEYNGYLNTTSKPLQANNWYHIVVTADNPGEHRKVYVNGQLIAETTSSSGPFGSVTEELTFGYASRNAEYFKGVIDDIGFYDKELTDTEITALYQGSYLIEEKEICSSETPYAFGSQQLSESGTYYETYQTITGCDSVVQLNLTVHPTYNDTIGQPSNYLVDDDFENDVLGTLPDGWVIRYGGTGNADQKVVSAPVKNGVQSFQVSGSGWAANLSKPVTSFPEKVTLEAWVRIENVFASGGCGLSLGNPSVATWGSFLGRVETESGNFITYNHSGSATTKYILQPAVSGTWTHIKIDYDYSLFKYKVYINGQQASGTSGSEVLSEFPILQTVAPTSIELSANSMMYFDDVKLYESGSTALTICSSETPYTFGTQTLIEAGIYTETFQTVHGCDSVVTLNLIVNPAYDLKDTVTICESDLPYQFGDSTLNAPGTYTQVFTTVDGCDSIHTLDLFVQPEYNVSIKDSVCEGDLPYAFGNLSIDAPGQYTDTLQTTFGCDSIVTLNLFVQPEYNVSIKDSVCEGDLPYAFGNLSIDAPGQYADTLQTTFGCDSIVTLTLTITEPENIPPDVVCNPITIHLGTSGFYTLTDEDILDLTEGTTDNAGNYEDLKIEVAPGSFSCEQAGTHVPVRIIVTDLQENADTCYTTVQVLDNTLPSISCKDISITLDDNGLAGINPRELYSSVYDACGIRSVTVNKNLFSCDDIGLNTVMVRATDNNGNLRSCNAVVEVLGYFGNPSVDSVYDIQTGEDSTLNSILLTGISDGSVCEDNPLDFTLSFTNSSLIESYEFTYTEGEDSGTFGLVPAENANGESAVTLLITNRKTGKEFSTVFNLTVLPVNDPPFLVYPLEDLEMTVGSRKVIEFSAEKGITFDDVDGEELLTLSLKQANDEALPDWLVFRNDSLFALPSVADTGCIALNLVATDLAGLEATALFNLCVDYTVGARLFEQGNITVYPNPTSGKVYIDFSGSNLGKAEVSVLNALGEKVLQEIIAEENITELDLSGYVSGFYFIKIRKDEAETVYKLILTRQ